VRAAAQRDPFDTVREHEALRGILRRELRTAGQRTLAPEIGIGRGALRKFLAMSTPGHDTIDRLREWSEDRPAVDVAPGSVALAVLAGSFPAPRRAWARRQIARRVAELLSKVGAGTPSWLAEESSGRPFHP
jgi:hypothetical protein